MFGLGMGEIVLIAVVALLVLGPDRLPGAAKVIGKGIRDLRKQTQELKGTIERDTQLGDAVREIRGALRGDPETLYKRATGEDFNPPKDAVSQVDPAVATGEKPTGEKPTGDEPATGVETAAADEDKPREKTAAEAAAEIEVAAHLAKAADAPNVEEG